MLKTNKLVILAVVLSVVPMLMAVAKAQNFPDARSTQVQLNQGLYPLIPISSTNAVGSAAVLTIPAPQGGLYNYVCSLQFNGSQNGTSTAVTNGVTTSTNFNSFALKFSMAATANLTYDWSANWGTPSTGCVKSPSPGVTTTFSSPTTAQASYTWEASYYQAP